MLGEERLIRTGPQDRAGRPTFLVSRLAHLQEAYSPMVFLFWVWVGVWGGGGFFFVGCVGVVWVVWFFWFVWLGGFVLLHSQWNSKNAGGCQSPTSNTRELPGSFLLPTLDFPRPGHEEFIEVESQLTAALVQQEKD